MREGPERLERALGPARLGAAFSRGQAVPGQCPAPPVQTKGGTAGVRGAGRCCPPGLVCLLPTPAGPRAGLDGSPSGGLSPSCPPRRIRGLAGAGSAGRVNREECGGRNVHADEMDANLMLMSGGRPGPRRQRGSGGSPARARCAEAGPHCAARGSAGPHRALPASPLSSRPYGAAAPAARPCLGKRGVGSFPYPMAGRRRGITTAKSSTSTTTRSRPAGSTPGTGGAGAGGTGGGQEEPCPQPGTHTVLPFSKYRLVSEPVA